MNILSLLSKELEDKNWTIEEKCRYLYIRSCQLFCYDERYDFCDLGLYKGVKLTEIKDRVIDLENLIDNRVICTTHAREVFSKIMKEILNIECRENGSLHIWNTFRDGTRIINADATLSSDLARVKMGLATNGYRTAMDIYSFKDDIKKTDKKIGYIEDEYENYFLEKRIAGLLEEFIECSQSQPNADISDCFYIYKLSVIKELFEKYKLPSFSDSEYCIDYLIKKILQDDKMLARQVMLFDDSHGKEIELVYLYPFQLSNRIVYFILQKLNSDFSFHEITESDAKNYVKSLPGINRNIILNS